MQDNLSYFDKNRTLTKRTLALTVFTGVFVLLLTVFALASFGWQNLNNRSDERITAFEEGWTLTDSYGRVLDEDVSLPYSMPEEGRSITFSRHISSAEGFGHGCSLLFDNNRQSMSITVNGENIYDINMTDLRYFLMATSVCTARMAYEDDAELAVTIYNSGHGVYELPQIYVGSTNTIYSYILKMDFVTFVSVIVLSLFTVILLISYGYLRFKGISDRKLPMLVCFAVVVIGWAITDSVLINTSGISIDAAALISYAMFQLIPIPMLCYTMLLSRKWHLSLLVTIIIDCVVILIRAVATLTGMGLLNETLPLGMMCMVLAIISCMLAARNEMHGYPDTWNTGLFTGFAILFAASIATVFAYVFNVGNLYRSIQLCGISIFYIIIAVMAFFSNATELQTQNKNEGKLHVLENEANTDKLTSLSNRRAFEAMMSGIERDPNSYSDAVLIMLDLNGLKYTNDTYGHSAGDELIASAAKCIKETIGSGNYFYRIGGDEFAVILHNYSGSVNMRLAEMRKWIENYNKISKYKLSIAHGESTLRYLSGGLRSVSDWKQDADINMYSNKRLSSMHRVQDKADEYQEIIRCIINTVETRYGSNAEHSARVKKIAVFLAGKIGLTEEEIHRVEVGALLHDIGKISIPDSILLKPGKLDVDEYEIIKHHSQQGAWIFSGADSMQETANIILHHHERYDGRGYPDGLAGEEIPIGSRIVSIADSIDAMLSKRPYRGAYDLDHCRTEIARNLGTMYDPNIGRVVLDNWNVIVNIVLMHPTNLEDN